MILPWMPFGLIAILLQWQPTCVTFSWSRNCSASFKVSIRPTGFLWFWYFYNIWKCIHTKKKNNNNNNSCAFFALKSSFKFPASTSPNEVNRVMKDWRRMTSLQEHLKASYFYFAWLTTALFDQLRFVCFLSTKTPNHYWNNSDLN